MEGDALWAEDGTLTRFEDRGGRFEEEEGFLGPDVVEFFDVVALGEISWTVSRVNLGAAGIGRAVGVEERVGRAYA